jgi:hypothetical protein
MFARIGIMRAINRHVERVFDSSRKTSVGGSGIEEGYDMKLTHRFAEMTPDKRPQDPHMDRTGLRFETMEHGGEYPDTMPQAIKLTEAQAGPRSMCRSRKTARWSTATDFCSTRRMMMTGDVVPTFCLGYQGDDE